MILQVGIVIADTLADQMFQDETDILEYFRRLMNPPTL